MAKLARGYDRFHLQSLCRELARGEQRLGWTFYENPNYILSASPSLPYALKTSLNSAKLGMLGLGLGLWFWLWLGSGLWWGLPVWQG